MISTFLNLFTSFSKFPFRIFGHFAFISFTFSATLIVPTDYSNIQAGIDASAEGDSVLVLDGEYTGEGNYDIIIFNKGNNLLSESGPGNCIINAQCLGRGLYIQ